MKAGAPTLAQLAQALSQGSCTSRSLVQTCLENIRQERGEGARSFLFTDGDAALAQAEAVDRARRFGKPLSPWAGIPVSVKDNFDVRGQSTGAGSLALRNNAPAVRDALAVARLKRAGFIVVGRTNMTEFAYSGLGINPHYGTPRNPWRRDVGHAPGGSSSGAAVSVTDGMAHAALGTDTGGSCRIPAAWTGLVGYKPSQSAALLRGTVPLSPSLDTAGVLARSVACCASLGDVLHGTKRASAAGPQQDMLLVPQTLVLDALDQAVATAFERALSRLSRVGIRIVEVPLPEFARMPEINALGGLPAAESFHWHQPLLARARAQYDPLVLRRIARGAGQSASDYQALLQARDWLRGRVTRLLGSHCALVLPTVAITPPRLVDLEDEVLHEKINALSLRNTALVNFIDGCAVSLPMHAPGDAPAGLMLACRRGADASLLAWAERVETALRDAWH